MKNVIPPLCLLLALASLIAAFAIFSVEPPQASLELHEARVEGDEQYQDVLEEQLLRRQRRRKFLVTSLFISGGIFTVAAFLTMRPAHTPTK